MLYETPDLPGRIVAKFPVLYEYIYNKYFIDQLYDAAVVEPSRIMAPTSCGTAWMNGDRRHDKRQRRLHRLVQRHLRKLETRFVQNNALAILAGVVIVAAI